MDALDDVIGFLVIACLILLGLFLVLGFVAACMYVDAAMSAYALSLKLQALKESGVDADLIKEIARLIGGKP